MNRPPKSGDESPWGRIQCASELLPGIVSVSTASHGGLWLAPEREAQVPANLRTAARYSPANWYEEDCDCCVVGVVFADELIAAGQGDFVQSARLTVGGSSYFTGAPSSDRGPFAGLGEFVHADGITHD